MYQFFLIFRTSSVLISLLPKKVKAKIASVIWTHCRHYGIGTDQFHIVSRNVNGRFMVCTNINLLLIHTQRIDPIFFVHWSINSSPSTLTLSLTVLRTKTHSWSSPHQVRAHWWAIKEYEAFDVITTLWPLPLKYSFNSFGYNSWSQDQSSLCMLSVFIDHDIVSPWRIIWSLQMKFHQLRIDTVRLDFHLETFH